MLTAEESICPATTRHIVAEWRRLVKENTIDEFWKMTQLQMKELLKSFMEGIMQEEVVVYTGREWNQRQAEKIDYRNGYRYRDLVTPYGRIDKLKVPRLRGTGLKTKVFKNYQRRMACVDRALRDIFLAGVSTRRVSEALSCLVDVPVSSTTVSNITKSLDRYVRSYQNRALIDEYQYLLLDGITLKVKEGLHYTKRAVLTAYGITLFGIKEQIGFRQVTRETKPAWTAFLNDLYRRGLEGRNLRLITIDGHKGLQAALEEVYPFIPVQRCWAHKLRNVVSYLPQRHQKACSKEASLIYNAASKQEALQQFKIWKRHWISVSERAVACLEKDLPEMLNFFDQPKEHRKKVRTTNAIERSFREVRRRVRTMNCFSNPASCDRIIFAIFNHQNKHWKEHPLEHFSQVA
jgi:transposase-like protein